jgi:TonB family protein
MGKHIIFVVAVLSTLFSCNESQTTINQQNYTLQDNTDSISKGQSNSGVRNQESSLKHIDTSSKSVGKLKNNAHIPWTRFLKKSEKKQQIFLVSTEVDTLIKCNEGTTIKIRSNSFVSERTGLPIAGKMKIIVNEYYTLLDIIAANLSTTSDGKLLETGGMIYISATINNENCILKKGKTIEIGFPTIDNNNDMQLFTGIWDSNTVNWKPISNSIDLNKVYTIVDVAPKFPGGEIRMGQFISKQITYPPGAMALGVEGNVLIRVLIDRFGYVKDAVVARSLYPDCDTQALNAALKLPRFKPAILKNEFVTMNLYFP